MHFREFLDELKDSEYFKFLENRRKVKVEEGEIHHIYLRGFEDGQIDSEDNLIRLSRVDHIKAHILLVRSLEQMNRSLGRTYRVAEAAVNGMLSFRWSNLTEQDKDALLQFVPDLFENWQKCRKAALVSRTATNLQKYGGNTGMLNTRSVQEKSLQTRKKRYGSYTAQCMTPEAREKVRQKQIERYGEAGGQLHTLEAKQRSRKTRVEKYGTEMGCMNTPEVVQKRIAAQRESARLRTAVMHSLEFLQWFDRSRFKTKQGAVKSFLEETGKKLEDYK